MYKIYFASDHAGFDLKNALIEHVQMLGYEVEDTGSFVQDPNDDYPDFMLPLALKISEDNAQNANSARGVIVGGSGQGEAMCANRVQGVRAAVFYGEKKAIEKLDIEGGRSEDGFDLVRLARKHNDANVLSIGARFVSENEAANAVHIFLETPFSDAPRHARRIAKF